MEAGQAAVYGIIALLVFLYIRRMWHLRSLKQVTPATVTERLANRENIVLLDIRTKAERERGTIKGSIHIPLIELRKRLDELKRYKETEIVCYCASGSRSLSAAALLGKQGFSASSLKGGIAAWNFLQQK